MGLLFIKTIIHSADPTYGSGSRIGSVGLVCILGVSLILLGVIIMAIMNWIRPEFFRARACRFGHDHHDIFADAAREGSAA